MRIKLTTLVALLALMLSTSCKKDEYVNLKASIAGESSLIGTVEGSPFIYNLSLSKELSEDLPIKLTIDTTQTVKYINKDDYDPIFEYSSDSGRTWRKGTESSVTFPKNTKDLKIRLNTLDDKRLEVHEEFTLNFTVDADNKFSISGLIDPVKCLVQDNEKNGEEPVVFGFAVYAIDANNNFELISISRDINSKDEKAIIDNGIMQEVKDDIIKVTSLGEVGIRFFEAIFSAGDGGVQGVVLNTKNTTGEDVFRMGLDLSLAYYISNPNPNNPEDITRTPQKYNEDGVFGFVLAHEYGHVMTLNQAKEMDIFTGPDECSRLYIREGCAREGSVLDGFNTAFYDESVMLNEPTHVTPYAMSHIAEDIAETFAYYISQEDTPISSTDSSGALRKINFVANNNTLKDLRTSFRDIMNIKIPASNSEVRARFNRTKDGERISCIDHKGLIQVHKDGLFKTN